MKPDIIDNFKNKKIFVLGDIMLDKYVYGSTERISAEAPVPIVQITSENNILGGAGNVAANLASLGCDVALCGVAGNDSAFDILKEVCKQQKIDSSLIIKDLNRPTTVKKRVISGNNYQMIRLDYEEKHPISIEIQEQITKLLRNNLDKFDAIILSDYNKGFLVECVIRETIELAKVPIIVDCKPKNAKLYKGCTLITPNLKEAKLISGLSENVKLIGEVIVELLDCDLFITMGSKGIAVFDKKKNYTQVDPIKVTKVFDVTGAGDTVVAVATLGLISGFGLEQTARISNYAAGLVVQTPGTSTITPHELKKTLELDYS